MVSISISEVGEKGMETICTGHAQSNYASRDELKCSGVIGRQQLAIVAGDCMLFQSSNSFHAEEDDGIMIKM
jgi:hypothetical protein